MTSTRKTIVIIIVVLSMSVLLGSITIFLYTQYHSDQYYVSQLEAKVIPLLDQNNIQQIFYNRSWCEILVDDTGAYLNVAEPLDFDNCAAHLQSNTLEHIKPFTPMVNAKYRMILSALNSHGPKLYQIIRTDKSTTMDVDTFFSRISYTYQPGYTLPNDEEYELWHYPINDRWYKTIEDWN